MNLERKFIEYDYFLDDEKQNKVYIRIRLNPSNSLIESFSITYTNMSEPITHQILRIDASEKERIHIHYFFQKPPTKEYHNKPVSGETINNYQELIQTNWRWYWAQYKDNYLQEGGIILCICTPKQSYSK